MARILAYTSPARGHLYPLTPALDELRQRGHEIVLHTLASEVDLMRERGFEVEPLDAAVEVAHDDYRARTPHGAVKRALRVFAKRAARIADAFARAGGSVTAADAVEGRLLRGASPTAGAVAGGSA